MVTLAGIAAGLGAALMGTRGLTTLLFGVGPMDSTTFIGIVMVLLVTSGVASYVPVRRVYRIDPVSAIGENA
jgi:ABC-type antimicrobial peptide transport system permease subunit